MTRPRHPPSVAPEAPERGVKAATSRLLLDTAMALIQQGGHIPSVAEVAAHARVSRATAYRYFPSRAALITAVMDASLGPVRAFVSEVPDGRGRVRELFEQTFPRFKEFEPQMRAAIQLSLEQWALERAGQLDEQPYRRGHRIRILERALAPFAAQLPKALHERLHKALSVVYGQELFFILKDIWDVSHREAERTALWMADALIDAALREAAVTAPPSRGPSPPKPAARKATAPRGG